jgi:hypothetical protein
MEFGRQFTGWSKCSPKVRWVMKFGKNEIGRLKYFAKLICFTAGGRDLVL